MKTEIIAEVMEEKQACLIRAGGRGGVLFDCGSLKMAETCREEFIDLHGRSLAGFSILDMDPEELEAIFALGSCGTFHKVRVNRDSVDEADFASLSEELAAENSAEQIKGMFISVTGSFSLSLVTASGIVESLLDRLDDELTAGLQVDLDPDASGDYCQVCVWTVKGKIVPGKEITGLRTGFRELDRITGGLGKQELILLGGRPAMGTTAFALSVALHAAEEASAAVRYFCLDMFEEKMRKRLLTMESPLQPGIVIDDSLCPTVSEIREKCLKQKADWTC